MVESPKFPTDVSRTELPRISNHGAPKGETAYAADSVPITAGPFTVLPVQFGRYRIEKLLGKGMMGAVYLAHDTQLDRPVALKVARVSSSGSARLIKRMETEAKSAAKIDHPLICKIHDFGEIDGIRFIAMQYIAGEDLKSYLKRVGRKRTPAEATGWILQLADALAAAHEHGVIHRDLKPENVMLNRKGEPVIMDFGLARLGTGTAKAGLTQGMILGTAAYMSPEQAVGKADGIDHRSDIYSLGVMLFEMLTGEWPFTGSAIEIMGKKCVQDAPSPLSISPEIHPRVAAVCNSMIAKTKEDRYATCAEMIKALESINVNSPPVYEMKLDHASNEPVVESQIRPSFEFFEGLPNPSASRNHIQIRYHRKSIQAVSIAIAAIVRGIYKYRRRMLAAAAVLLLMSLVILTIRNKNGVMTKIEDSASSQVDLTMKSSPIHDSVARSPRRATSWQGWPTDAPAPAIAPFDTEQARMHQEAWAKYLKVPVEYTNSIGMRFRLIPPGEFLMGSTKAEIDLTVVDVGEYRHWKEYIRSEAPRHPVVLTQPFFMSVYEVTQSQYEKVMTKNPSHFSANGAGKGAVTEEDTSNHPVDTVNWFDACDFCVRLSHLEKVLPAFAKQPDGNALINPTGYRLPTEAEWEYGCRAGTTTGFWSGDKNEDLLFVGWFNANSNDRTHAVGKLSSNPFGLYDVHGNVWEWVQDGWKPTFYDDFNGNPAVNPVCPFPLGAMGVIRGGQYYVAASHCRSSVRLAAGPTLRGANYGFRVSLTVEAVNEALAKNSTASAGRN